MLMLQVTQHIATCQPLSGALDNGRVILCDMMADPWVSVRELSAPMGGEHEQDLRQARSRPPGLYPSPHCQL